MATQMTTLQTLFSHPSEFAKKHRESPEVQPFKQNPSRDSMVNYIASQTLTHNELLAYNEEGSNVWDVLTERLSQRATPESDAYWQTTEDDDYYDDDNQEEEQAAPRTTKRRRVHVLEEDEEEAEDHDAFNTPESSGKRAIFITQPDPEPYHEPGTLTRTEKGKTAVRRQKTSTTTNVWESFGLHTAQPSTLSTTATTAPKRRGTTGRPRPSRGTTRASTRGRGRGSRAKTSKSGNEHIFFEQLSSVIPPRNNLQDLFWQSLCSEQCFP